ncbi:hypothetical protein [Flavobacterium piscis]|uniref:Lipoprotein n=1 Tax=Flavobacterium piscis TaxID=1114874 RepID=A0ABU1YCT2_9FLAO|nr:hypothetical protein [Flavobacterium piscis]MDR7211331.1 hypothetical protein [Flavobacterium piscis]
MKKNILSIVVLLFISCNKTTQIEKNIKSKEDLILLFCKQDISVNSISPSTIKYDSLLTSVFEVEKKSKYYNEELDDAYGMKQINDSTSKKWQASIHYDSENKYGANIRNEVTYVIKENIKYYQDSIFNPQFIILSKRDQNKLHEYLGIK